MQPKLTIDDERDLKVGNLIWPIDESVRRHASRMARVVEVFPGDDGVVQLAPFESVDGVLRRTTVKLAPVFNDCFQNENRAGEVGSRNSQSNEF